MSSTILFELLILDYIDLYFKSSFNLYDISLNEYLQMSEDQYSDFVKYDCIPYNTQKLLEEYYLPNKIIRALVHLKGVEKLDTLLNCPFCGGNMNYEDKMDIIYPNKHKDYYSINCVDNCGGSIIGLTRLDAIARWNTRKFKKDL
jgi:hypothetical protein